MPQLALIDTNKVYTSKNYGDFKIIKEVERRGANRYVRIKFTSTGYECDVALSSATKGAVKDPTYISQTDFVHPKHGPYKILDKYSKPDHPKNLFCHVLFERTGNVLEFMYHNAIKGEIKNPYDRIIYGIACIGIPRRPYNTHMYNIWRNMLSRCYDPNYEHYRYYGGAGVTVCDRWLIFEYFLEDAYNLPNGEHAFEDGWQLDKDSLQSNCKIKVYSPDTCIWIPAYVNVAINTITCRKNGNASTPYYGVYPNEHNRSYSTYINTGEKTKSLGTFNDPISAAVEYNLEALNIGNKALNQVPYVSAYNRLCTKHGVPMPDPNMCIIVNPIKRGY